MATLVMDRTLEKSLREEREASGADRYDEVWEGIYLMTTLPNDEHQELVADLVAALRTILGWNKLDQIRAGVNVSDRDAGWTHNYRVPDVAVFLQGTQAVNHGTHWQGGPDFAVEILSAEDRTREKLDYYARIGVRELMLIDRDPWQLELYRLQAGQLMLVAQASPGDAKELASDILPLRMRLVPGSRRPMIEVVKNNSNDRWLV